MNSFGKFQFNEAKQITERDRAGRKGHGWQSEKGAGRKAKRAIRERAVYVFSGAGRYGAVHGTGSRAIIHRMIILSLRGIAEIPEKLSGLMENILRYISGVSLTLCKKFPAKNSSRPIGFSGKFSQTALLKRPAGSAERPAGKSQIFFVY